MIRLNPFFRMFSTTNTIGQGETVGSCHGAQQINKGHTDRCSIVAIA